MGDCEEENGRREELLCDPSDKMDNQVDVECHLKWLYEMLPLVPEHLLEIAGTAENHISGLLAHDRLSEEEEALYRRVTDLCWKLNLAAQYTFVGDFDSAMKSIKMADEELNFHLKLDDASMHPSASHVAAYNYVIRASSYMVLRQMLGKHGLLTHVNLGAETDQLRFGWEDLMKDDSAKAVVMFLKACLGSSIRLADDFVLKTLKKAAALEPDFHGWYRYIYRKQRQIRRNGINRIMIAPSEDEKNACKMAYRLRSDVGDNIANMANMLEESLHFDKRSMKDDDIQAKLETLTGLLEESINLVADPWVKIRLAEIHSYGGYNLDPLVGEQLFRECTETWPMNTMVWHKAGKFYHLGGNSRGGGPYVDPEKAKDFYMRALSLRASNFPCVMDLLKLLLNAFNDIDQMVDTIDKFVPMMRKEGEIKKLLTTKGLVLWIHNVNEKSRHRACVTWIEIINKFPSAMSEVARAIKRERHEIVGLLDINMDELVTMLQKLADEVSAVVSGSTKSIEKFIVELKKNSRKENGGDKRNKPTFVSGKPSGGSGVPHSHDTRPIKQGLPAVAEIKVA